MIGIYQIRNIINNKRYIGSSVNVKTRFRDHRYLLSTHKHKNPILQNSWDKHGRDKFEFTVLAECDCSPSVLRFIETMYLYNLSPEYNIIQSALRCSRVGRKMPASFFEKVSGKNHCFYGKKLSAEHRRNIGLGGIGKQAGEKHWAAKLNKEKVLFARFLKSAWDIPYTKLGRYFDVSPQTVHDAVTKRTWRHL